MQRSTIVLVLFAALAACSHASQSSTSTSAQATAQSGASAAPVAASPAAASPAAASPGAAATAGAVNGAAASIGASIYQTNCSSCHQASGQGMPGTFPPLAGNPVVNGPAAAVIHIVKNGLTGSISVNGTTYNGQMPAWSATLSNNDIAAVITYVRSAWGNHASAVTPAQVAATH